MKGRPLSDREKIVREHLEAGVAERKRLAEDPTAVLDAAELVISALKGGKRVFFCGNGGSAADSQHLAAELTGRYRKERKALPVMALTANTSEVTAIGNDYGYEHVFRRQVEAHLRAGDVLVGISTSGKSPNVVEAAKAARAAGGKVIAFTGAAGGPLAAAADVTVAVPSTVTARIQEMHIAVGHVICDLVERELFQCP